MEVLMNLCRSSTPTTLTMLLFTSTPKNVCSTWRTSLQTDQARVNALWFIYDASAPGPVTPSNPQSIQTRQIVDVWNHMPNHSSTKPSDPKFMTGGGLFEEENIKVFKSDTQNKEKKEPVTKSERQTRNGKVDARLGGETKAFEARLDQEAAKRVDRSELLYYQKQYDKVSKKFEAKSRRAGKIAEIRRSQNAISGRSCKAPSWPCPKAIRWCNKWARTANCICFWTSPCKMRSPH